jgi:hypothetical protein
MQVFWKSNQLDSLLFSFTFIPFLLILHMKIEKQKQLVVIYKTKIQVIYIQKEIHVNLPVM